MLKMLTEKYTLFKKSGKHRLLKALFLSLNINSFSMWYLITFMSLDFFFTGELFHCNDKVGVSKVVELFNFHFIPF